MVSPQSFVFLVFLGCLWLVLVSLERVFVFLVSGLQKPKNARKKNVFELENHLFPSFFWFVDQWPSFFWVKNMFFLDFFGVYLKKHFFSLHVFGFWRSETKKNKHPLEGNQNQPKTPKENQKNKTLRWNHIFPFKRLFFSFLVQRHFLNDPKSMKNHVFFGFWRPETKKTNTPLEGNQKRNKKNQGKQKKQNFEVKPFCPFQKRFFGFLVLLSMVLYIMLKRLNYDMCVRA